MHSPFFVADSQQLLLHAYVIFGEQPLSHKIRDKNARHIELIDVREQKSSCLKQGNFSKTAQKCSPPELIRQMGSVRLGAVDGASSTAPEACPVAEGVVASGCHNACSGIVFGYARPGAVSAAEAGGRDRIAHPGNPSPVDTLTHQEFLQRSNRLNTLKARMTLLATEAGMTGITFHHHHGDEHRPITPLTVETASATIRLAKVFAV